MGGLACCYSPGEQEHEIPGGGCTVAGIPKQLDPQGWAAPGIPKKSYIDPESAALQSLESGTTRSFEEAVSLPGEQDEQPAWWRTLDNHTAQVEHRQSDAAATAQAHDWLQRSSHSSGHTKISHECIVCRKQAEVECSACGQCWYCGADCREVHARTCTLQAAEPADKTKTSSSCVCRQREREGSTKEAELLL